MAEAAAAYAARNAATGRVVDWAESTVTPHRSALITAARRAVALWFVLAMTAVVDSDVPAQDVVLRARNPDRFAEFALPWSAAIDLAAALHPHFSFGERTQGSSEVSTVENLTMIMQYCDDLSVFPIAIGRTWKREVSRASEELALFPAKEALFAEIGLDDETERALSDKSLVKYLHGSFLITECRDAALGLSRDAWERAGSFLITVPR